MFSQRANWAFLTFTLALLTAAQAWAADVLDAIPNTALGVVLVNRLDATSDKIEKLAVKVQAPSVSLLSLMRVQTGIYDGLDDKATAAMAWLPAESGPLDSPTSIVVLPITDYDKFVKRLQPENVKDQITQISLANKPVLCCRRGDFVVLASVDDESALKDVLASVKSVGEDLLPLRTWLNEVDVAAVATPAVIKLVSNMAGDSFSAQIALFEQGGFGESNVQALKIAQKVLTASGEEVQLAAIGVRADEAGTVRVQTRLRLSPAGQWASAAKSMEGSNQSLLTGLPSGDFVAAAGFQYNEPARKLVDWFFGEEGQKLNPALRKLPEEQRTKFADGIRQLMAQVEDTRMWVGTTKPDEPLLTNTYMVAKVDDAKKYLNLTEEWTRLQMSLGKGEQAIEVTEINRIQVDGLDALETVSVVSKTEGGGPPTALAGLTAIFKKMLGSGDKIRGYAAAVDDHTVVMAYASQDNLRRAIAAVKNGADAKKGLDPQAAEVAGILPVGAQVVGLLHPAGISKWVQSLNSAAGGRGQVPDFPASPPIGLALKVSSAGVLGEAVVPGGALEAIGQFIAAMRDR